ncbi:MAG: molybdopterin-binding protein, partial [Selenomonadaceae bacterium]|nr:molybdopterin-binding protein [Selenomonadaceae bacterium]
MKEIKTSEAVGHILCHDLTQIIRGVTKDARFRKGHIVTKEDIPVLLSMGKENLFVWENDGTMLHEDEAAEILRSLTQNKGMSAS